MVAGVCGCTTSAPKMHNKDDFKRMTLREQPTGADDLHNSDIIRIIMIVNENQFRRMFQVSRHGFEAVLE